MRKTSYRFRPFFATFLRVAFFVVFFRAAFFAGAAFLDGFFRSVAFLPGLGLGFGLVLVLAFVLDADLVRSVFFWIFLSACARITPCADANRATGTRYGEQLT